MKKVSRLIYHTTTNEGKLDEPYRVGLSYQQNIPYDEGEPNFLVRRLVNLPKGLAHGWGFTGGHFKWALVTEIETILHKR